VHGGDDGLGLGRRQAGAQLEAESRLVLVGGGEVTLHRPDEGPGEEADQSQVLGPLGGVDGDAVVSVPRRGHAVEVAGVVDVETPEFACLVPPAVRGVGAEDEEESQGRRKEGEGGQGEGEHGEGFDDRLVLHAVQIGVPPRESIPYDEEGRDAGRRKDLLGEALVNAAVYHRGEVAYEPVGRAVLHPLLVCVDGPAVLPGSLAVGLLKDDVGRRRAHIQGCGGGRTLLRDGIVDAVSCWREGICLQWRQCQQEEGRQAHGSLERGREI